MRITFKQFYSYHLSLDFKNYLFSGMPFYVRSFDIKMLPEVISSDTLEIEKTLNFMTII